ncbi:MAG: hypothetical protein MUQ00_03875 [Candidatus Aminicenantes bacterium]|nr:hypothetical protein [Candidatus Aminicenantes bacterium]
MPRSDLTKYLVHWTKGANYEEGFSSLRRIVFEKRLLGSGELIKGGWQCVCFTEAPETTFHQVVGKYKPFGIQVPKSWLFRLGGRPVIYQSNAEYNLLPENLRWRHMRYEPDANPPFDFSWEREWRIQTNELQLEPAYASILIPGEAWARELIREHEENEHFEREFRAAEYGEEWLMYPLDDFSFRYTVINV